MLDRLIKKLNEPDPEFVDEKWIANAIQKDVDYVRKIHITEMIPFRLDKYGHKVYKTSAIKFRIKKYRLTPPSTDHPLYEMTQEEAMVYLNIHSPAKYLKHVREGHLKVHLNKDGKKRIYCEDADQFLRTFDRMYLLKFIREPLLWMDAGILLGNAKNYVRKMVKRGRFKIEPRKKGEVRRIGQATLIEYVQSMLDTNHKFRPNPIPDYIPRSIAEIYCSPVPDARNALRARMIVCEKYTDPNGVVRWGISKAKLDEMISKCWRARCYGTEKTPYYNSKNVEFIFGKTQAWIDHCLRGKCPLVDKYGQPVDKMEAFKHVCGWDKKAVEELVASGVEYYPKIFLAKKIHKPEPKRFTTPKPRTFLMQSAKDIIEAALDSAYSERELAKEQHAREAVRKANAKNAEKDALRVELGIETMAPPALTRANVLRNSESREIITLVYNHQNCNIFKDRSLSRYDLAVFVHDQDFRLRRRVMNNSITRLVLRGISNSIMSKVRLLPEWIIIVPGTSIINDINLYETLHQVPPEIMAVAPFGYEYTQFDGTWTRCSSTYGYYQKYSLNPPSNEMVLGTSAVNGMHPVAVLDGPFVAIRGEMVDKIKEIHYFNDLGECRSSMGPIVSAVCRRYRLGMMQIPVSSSCSAEYSVPTNSPRWHEIEDRIITYVSATPQAIARNRKKESF